MNKIVPSRIRHVLSLSIAMIFTGTYSKAATVVWTDTDSPMGRVWINSGNPTYGGDVHIQNTGTFYFSSNIANVSTLAIEAGGKLVADGHIHTTTNSSNSDALLVTNGGKAYFNGDLTAVNANPSSNYYVIAVTNSGSELHTNGTTNVIAPELNGYGIHVGNNTFGYFNGAVNVHAGGTGIYNIGQSIYQEAVNINMQGASAATSYAVYANNSPTGSLDFNSNVSISMNSNSSTYNYGVFSANSSQNKTTFNGELSIDLSNVSGGTVGVYTGGGQVNINNNFTILNQDGSAKYALYSANSSQININDSVVNITGTVQAIGNSTINLNSLVGSKINGDTVLSGTGQIHYNLTGTQWYLSGNSQLSSLIGNNTNIHLADSTYTSFRRLSIGSLAGNGITFWLNTLLDDGSSQQTDKLVITDTITGTHKLNITNTDGLGALTLQGIEVVETPSSSNNDFRLDRPVTAGAYEYILNKDQTNQNWYLTSLLKTDPIDPVEPNGPNEPENPNIILRNPSISAYLANQTAASNLFLHTLYDRQGHSSVQNKSSMWVRVASSHIKNDSLNASMRVDTDSHLVHLGGNIGQWQIQNSNLQLGFMAAYGQTQSNVISKLTGTTATGEVTGYNIGLYGTWLRDEAQGRGLYIDSWIQYGWYKNKITGVAQINKEETYDSNNWSTSLEAGYALHLLTQGNTAVMLTPQVQVTYNHYKADDHQDGNHLKVSGSKVNDVITRLGARLYGKTVEGYTAKPYLEANWIHHTVKNGLNFNGETLKDGVPKDRAEVKLGLQGSITKNWNIWGQIGSQWGSNDYTRFEGQMGVNYHW